ncbi:MAG: beta-ketoacyl-ACP synthase 3 [Nanoarchaeota archaeon]
MGEGISGETKEGFYIRLSRPGVYVPSAKDPRNVITNYDLEKIVDTSDEWVTSRTGMKERRISHDKGVKEMGLLAAKDLLNKELIDSEQIDEIIFSTNRHSNEHEFPNHASYVARELEAREGIPCQDQAAGCTGLIYAIRTAYNTLRAEKDKDKILVIGSERLTDMTDYSDRSTCVLFGDGAGAFLVERFPGDVKKGIIKTFVGGAPDKGNSEWPNGFLSLEHKLGKKIKPSEDPDKKFDLYEKKQNYLVMNGKEVFKFATVAMKEAIHKVLEGTGYEVKDLDAIIPHGANIRITDAAKKGLEQKGFKGVVYTNLERYGNTSTASIAIAHDEAIEKEIIKKGSLYIIVGFGAGLTDGAILVRH